MIDLFAIQNTFAPALLAALIHSLWIGGILYLLLRVYLDLSAAHAAAARYRISVVTLLIQVFLTLLLFVYIYQPNGGSADLHAWIGAAADMPGQSRLAQGADSVVGVPGAPGIAGKQGIMSLADIALTGYLIGVLFFSVRLLIASTLIRKRISLGRDAAPQYTRLLERTRERTGIRRHIRLVISDHLQSPALYGFFRPVVIVPAGMLTHLSFDQVEVIMLHELIHLKKSDFLVNLFQQMVESLFFFNPFTWMISGLIREEREKRVDDTVTVHCNSATYAKALFNLSLLHNESSAAIMAATGGGQQLLLRRIQRILKVKHMKKGFKTRFYLSTIVAASAILVLSLSGFSSSLLQIDRQQTKAVGSAQPSASNGSVESTTKVQKIIQDPGTFWTVPASGNANQTASGGQWTIKADMDEVNPILPGNDTLTEKERKELMEALVRAREELESIDWTEEMSRLEEERARLLDELPGLLEEEQMRIQEGLNRLDKEMIRVQLERARRQLDSARLQIDQGAMRQQIEQHMQQLEAQIRSGEYPDEKTREAMERSLESLREIDLDEMMTHVQKALSDLDLNRVLNQDIDIDIDFDSILISVRKNLQEIDIEEIKANIDRSVKEIEMQMEQLKSSDTKKNPKN